ncbi:MAG: peptidyl-prolyl cis-trans isomerase [Planctomycetes bacterium]|nr:peptidyl-prolyl cis-trans isomerase [Planctomycetota bacterium]
MAKLELNLPPEPARRGADPKAAILLVLSVATLALVAWLALRGGGASPAPAPAGEAELLADLADTLERRTLYGGAAEVLARQIEVSRPAGEELGRLLFRRGRDLMLAGLHEDAARAFLEADARGLPEEERRRAKQLVLDCLSALGKHDARQEAARALAEYGRTEAGGPVARLAGETISAGELVEELGREARAELSMQATALPREAFEERAKEAVHARLRDENALREVAERMLAERVLYREATERKLDEEPESAKQVERFRRAYLANRVVQAVLEDVRVTALDVQNHYEAHKEDYAIPEAVRIEAARFDDPAAAAAALGKPGEIPFAPVEGWIERGGEVPGIGRSAEVEAHIFALEPGTPSDRPIEAAGASYLFRVVEKRPRRIPAFDEVRARAEADLLAAKRREAIARLQAELGLKFAARIEEEALRKLAGRAEEKAEPGASKAPEDGASGKKETL